MGTDILEVVEKLPSPCDIKVHSLMCTQLIELVERVDKIFPEIEAARPRCSSGIQSLCLLTGAIDKAKLLLHDCCESSKLYLAYKGITILSRSKKSKNLLEQSLSQIQNMVPVMLASEISRVIDELRVVTFHLDPSEEEAGKAVKASLAQYKAGECSGEDSAIEYIRIAAQKLHITTQKALLFERRSIKKLLNKLDEKDGYHVKKQIFLLLLSLLRKYGNSITLGQLEPENIVQDQDYYPSRKVDFRVNHDVPPDEFKCPISLKLMYDPVIIDSGQTFERMWIQKWFDEGHDICPKTKQKLSSFSLTQNTAMKDLISRWCENHKIALLDPCIIVTGDANSWDNSSSSINSLSISMNNLQLPVDYSNVSMSSLDNTCEMDVELCREIDDALPWESRCKIVEEIMIRLKHDDQARKLILNENFVESIVRFLKVARDMNDVKAQRIGLLLLLILITKCSIQYLNKDAYLLLSELLESEVIEESLAIIEALSSHQNCQPKIADSGAVTHIFKILNTGIQEIQTPALKILYNLTSRNTRSLVSSSDLIPKLVALFEDDSLSRYCMAILSNLCDKQSNRSIIAESEGCVSFVAKVLESESFEEQEQALEILVSLCSQSVDYCRLVMNKGVIPAVFSISINGNEKGKAKAFEMLRLLREIREVECDDCVEESPVSDLDVSKDLNGFCVEKKTGSKASRFLSKFGLVSRSSLAQKRKI